MIIGLHVGGNRVIGECNAFGGSDNFSVSSQSSVPPPNTPVADVVGRTAAVGMHVSLGYANTVEFRSQVLTTICWSSNDVVSRYQWHGNQKFMKHSPNKVLTERVIKQNLFIPTIHLSRGYHFIVYSCDILI